MFRKEFGEDFQTKVLFPSKEKLIQRDEERKIWTTGAERISVVYKEFEDIRDQIGQENFIDTSDQTPEQTVSVIIPKPQKNRF